jgi:hypothetical protein
MRSVYQRASFAALIVGSSIALLTGAQAETLTFGAPSRPCARGCGFGFNAVFAGIGVPGTGTFNIVSGGVRTNATFDDLTGGSWQLLPSSGFPASVGGFDGTTFTNIGPNTSTYTVSFPGTDDMLTGNLQVTSIQDNTTGQGGIVTLDGDLTVTSSSGALASTFGGPGSMAVFSFPDVSSVADSPSVEAVFASSSTSNVIFRTAGPGSITPVGAPETPLPPAIYLLGSVLGGAFWMSRRKRSAVRGLGSA